MLRTPIVLGATVAGMAAVLSFHPRAPSTGQAPRSAGVVAAAPARTASKPKARTPAAPTNLAVVGADVPNQYGDVQVRVKVSGGKIVSVTAVALPGGDPQSQQISTVAAPQLAQQAVASQSAQIDGVSGASYTSESYRQSLQSALDRLPSTAVRGSSA